MFTDDDYATAQFSSLEGVSRRGQDESEEEDDPPSYDEAVVKDSLEEHLYEFKPEKGQQSMPHFRNPGAANNT